MLRKLLTGRKRTAPRKQPDAPAQHTDAAESIDLPFAIRPATPADHAAIVRIFEDAIDGLAAEQYSARQRKAWKKTASLPAFRESLDEGITLVAENAGQPIAFAQLHPSDYLRMLYVSADWSGLGISTLLYQYLEDEARIAGARTLVTDASLRARRFFEQMGFSVSGEQKVKRQGVTLARLSMQKVLVKD